VRGLKRERRDDRGERGVMGVQGGGRNGEREMKEMGRKGKEGMVNVGFGEGRREEGWVGVIKRGDGERGGEWRLERRVGRACQ